MQRQLVPRLALVALVCVPACVLALGVVVALRPRSFASHEEAIGYMLEQHNVAYERISLAQTRLDTLNFLSYGRYSAPYGAGVTVQLSAGGHANGRIECQVQMTSCYLYLSELGFNGELVPEVTTEQRWGPLDWVWRRLPRMPVLVQRGPTPTPQAVP